jgi:phage terminase large subunit
MSLELLEKPETKRKEIELELSTKLLSVALSDARYKVFWGGRGGGKSYFIADFLLSKAVEPNKKYRTLCAREIMATIKDSVHRLLCDRINDLGLDRYFRITRDSITSIYGSEFFFKGLKSNVSEIKSMQRINYVWCEEAERISEESWNVLIPTIREEGSEIWISFNPEDEKASTYQRFIINPSPNCESIHLTYKDNKYFRKS